MPVTDHTLQRMIEISESTGWVKSTKEGPILTATPNKLEAVHRCNRELGADFLSDEELGLLRDGCLDFAGMKQPICIKHVISYLLEFALCDHDLRNGLRNAKDFARTGKSSGERITAIAGVRLNSNIALSECVEIVPVSSLSDTTRMRINSWLEQSPYNGVEGWAAIKIRMPMKVILLSAKHFETEPEGTQPYQEEMDLVTQDALSCVALVNRRPVASIITTEFPTATFLHWSMAQKAVFGNAHRFSERFFSPPINVGDEQREHLIRQFSQLQTFESGGIDQLRNSLRHFVSGILEFDLSRRAMAFRICLETALLDLRIRNNKAHRVAAQASKILGTPSEPFKLAYQFASGPIHGEQIAYTSENQERLSLLSEQCARVLQVLILEGKRPPEST